MEEQQLRILEQLLSKSSTKQQVWKDAQWVFGILKEQAADLAAVLNYKVSDVDARVVVRYTEKGEHEFRLQFSGDVLVFHLHTNAYALPEQHEFRKSSYLRDDPMRAYFGIINIYNFLNDSLRYNRQGDIGQLVGRIYINKERHFFVDGQRQLAFLYRDLANQVIQEENYEDYYKLRKVVKTAMEYALAFDLQLPSMQESREITVFQMENISNELRVRKPAALGFKTKSMLNRKVL